MIGSRDARRGPQGPRRNSPAWGANERAAGSPDSYLYWMVSTLLISKTNGKIETLSDTKWRLSRRVPRAALLPICRGWLLRTSVLARSATALLDFWRNGQNHQPTA